MLSVTVELKRLLMHGSPRGFLKEATLRPAGKTLGIQLRTVAL